MGTVKILTTLFYGSLLACWTILFILVLVMSAVWGWRLLFSTATNPFGILLLLIPAIGSFFGIKVWRTYTQMTRYQSYPREDLVI